MYRAHRAALLGYLVRRTSDAATAADLLADVFLVAWRRHETLPVVDEQRLWLFGIARNVLLNHHRRMTRDSRLGAKLAEALVIARPDAQPLSPERPGVGGAAVVVRAGSRAAHPGRLGRLHDRRDPTTMGLKPTAVRVAMHRARQRLRAALVAAGVGAGLSRADC